jgi:putative zinc finger/helix-turn-helix YgiT family protein
MAAPENQKCMVCRQQAVSPVRLDSYETELEHDGRKYAISVPDLTLLKCRNCGEVYLDDAADERLSEALRAAARLLSPSEIRDHRERLGLTREQLANRLRVPEPTLARWETGGQIQQRSMDAFLRVFFQSSEARRLLGDAEDTQARAGLGTPVPGGEFASHPS